EEGWQLVQLLEDYKYSLLNEEELIKIEKRTHNLDFYLKKIKRQLLEMGGELAVKRASQDPLLINKLIWEKLKNQQTGPFQIHPRRGRLWDLHENHILLIGSPSFPSSQREKTKKMLDFLEKTKEKITQKFPSQPIHIHCIGGHIGALENTQILRQDGSIAMILVTLALGILGFFFFQRKYFIPLMFLPPFFGITFGLACFVLLKKPISLIALGCGSLLVGITVDYGIHFLYHLDSHPNTKGNQVLKNLFLPLIMGAITTSLAFGCLLTSSIPALRQIGLLALFGILGAYLFTLFLFPLLLDPFINRKNSPKATSKNFQNYLVTFFQKHRTSLLFAYLVLLLCLLPGLSF
ncbi:MAG: hypothetical protein D6785_09875, partial [Planctomycetota bacterium]